MLPIIMMYIMHIIWAKNFIISGSKEYIKEDGIHGLCLVWWSKDFPKLRKDKHGFRVLMVE